MWSNTPHDSHEPKDAKIEYNLQITTSSTVVVITIEELIVLLAHRNIWNYYGGDVCSW